MKFAKLKENESLEELAARVATAPSAAALRRNVRALERANPHVRAVGDAADLVVAIPDALEGRLSEDALADPGAIAGSVMHRVRTRLNLAAETLPGAFDKEAQRANTSLERLNTPELTRLARSRPELKETLTRAKARAKERVETIEALQKVQERVVETVSADLSRLLETATEITGMASSLARGQAASRRAETDAEAEAQAARKREEEARRAEAQAARKREEAARRAADATRERPRRLTRADLPTVKELPRFVGRMDDAAEIRRLMKLDERTTAKPIYERRLKELQEKPTPRRRRRR